MARVTVEDCFFLVENYLPLIKNHFALVLLTTKRTRQLMAGTHPIIKNTKNKPPVLALREIATSKVRFDRSVRAAAGRRPAKCFRAEAPRSGCADCSA